MAKYECYFKPEIFYNIEKKPDQAVYFTLKKVYSQPCQTSKQEGYFLGGNNFHKKLHLSCLERF